MKSYRIILIFFALVLFLLGCDGQENLNNNSVTSCIDSINELNITITQNDIDTSMCDGIKSLPEKIDCYLQLAVEKEDPLICEKRQLYDGECSEEMADSDNLEKVQNYLRQSCYEAIILKTQNLSVCDEINDESDRIECHDIYYVNIGKEKMDSTFCDKVEDENKSISCYYYFARLNKDSLICDKIYDKLVQNICYFDTGKKVVFNHDSVKLSGATYNLRAGDMIFSSTGKNPKVFVDDVAIYAGNQEIIEQVDNKVVLSNILSANINKNKFAGANSVDVDDARAASALICMKKFIGYKGMIPISENIYKCYLEQGVDIGGR